MLPLAYTLFLINLLFGVLVKSGVVDNRRLRFVHHGLYALVMASLGGAVLAAAIRGNARQAWMLAAMALLLFGMPLFRGRSRGHWIYATFCSILYSALVLLAADG